MIVSNNGNSAQRGRGESAHSWPEMPEIRMLLSLRSHESRMRRRLALCDELCGSLEVLYRAARALAASGLGVTEGDLSDTVRRAPASAHTVCSMVRDMSDSFNHLAELVEFDVEADVDEPGVAGAAQMAAAVRKELFGALDEQIALTSWKQVRWIGLSCDPQHHLQFRWASAMQCVREQPERAHPGLRPVVLLATRVADKVMGLLDPLTGPIAEERAATYSTTKKLRAQIEHVRSLVNRKCDGLESEMRAVQNAIIKAQSQTMWLVKNLSRIGPQSD